MPENRFESFHPIWFHS